MKKYKDQEITLYNTLSSKKEKFVPITDGFVGMYVCGPTLYSPAHLGNVRTFLSFDVISRYLRHLGYKVRYVRNITDVGHLLDNDEDRVSKQSRLEKIEPMEVVQKYYTDFRKTLDAFNFVTPDIEPSASAHILEQWDVIRKLEEQGLAYESNGSVYFDVLKYNKTENYGELSKRNIEDLIPNTRDLEGQDEKRNPQDFALWKKAAPDHIMRWTSPWGVGFPGWHLECTAMSKKYLGEHFDIHGGGLDLKFPHHESEIAQAKGSIGIKPVNYWMHTNFLTINGQKMSKSAGNSVLPSELISGENDLFDKGFHPAILRFFMLQAHYRSPLDFTNEALLAAEKGYKRLVEGLTLLESLETADTTTLPLKEWNQKCYEALNDDFNTPILISQLYEAVKMIYAVKNENETITKEDKEFFRIQKIAFFHEILGIEDISSDGSEHFQSAMEVLIELRNKARNQKNFELSDSIRDLLAEKKIYLKDGKDGTTFELK